LFYTEPITLEPFENRAIEFELEVPADAAIGQYRVWLVADDLGQLAETDEANNIALSFGTVRIAERAPDFRVLSVRPLELTRRPGETLDVAYRLENFGNEPGRLDARAYISNNEAITTQDVVLGELSFATTPREVLTGTISATIPASLTTGTYWIGVIVDPDITVPELSESNNVGRAPSAITVSSDQVEIVTTVLPPATLGRAYSTQIAAAGGDGVFTYRLADGVLPRGMSFDAVRAELFGIPVELGSFALEIEATSGGRSASRTLTLEVLDPSLPLTLVTRELPPATRGEDYAVPIRAIGGREPYNWRLVEGTPPAGIALATDGTLVGVPSGLGTAIFVVELTDDAAATATATYSLEVRAPGNLTILTSELPYATLEQEYSTRLLAAGGVAPLLWTPTTTPPPGLFLETDGEVRGIPEVVGSFRFHVQVTDAQGNVDANPFHVVVEPSGIVRLVPDVLPEGVVGEHYRVELSAQGGDGPYDWKLIDGALPSGWVPMVSADTTGFVIEGDFEREGLWTFTLVLNDSRGRSDSHPLAIVARVPPKMTPKSEDDGCGCAVAASAAPAPAGLLPAIGLALVSFACRRRRPKVKS
jgi:hypothetical protein